jgi:hypothetical protein
MIELTGKPKTDVLVKIGLKYIQISFDRKGYLYLIRQVDNGRCSDKKPGKNETVFRVTDFANGEASFKSGESNCGYYSVNGCIYWSTIWEDDGNTVYKKCSFQDWANECAQVLAGVKEKITKY